VGPFSGVRLILGYQKHSQPPVASIVVSPKSYALKARLAACRRAAEKSGVLGSSFIIVSSIRKGGLNRRSVGSGPSQRGGAGRIYLGGDQPAMVLPGVTAIYSPCVGISR
jgi:hypothetical protein